MSTILEKIADIESEMARTQKNKATAGHLGMLKAKLAKLRRELITPKSQGGASEQGFEVAKVFHLLILNYHTIAPRSSYPYDVFFELNICRKYLSLSLLFLSAFFLSLIKIVCCFVKSEAWKLMQIKKFLVMIRIF